MNYSFDEFDMSPLSARLILGVYGGFILYCLFIRWYFSSFHEVNSALGIN